MLPGSPITVQGFLQVFCCSLLPPLFFFFLRRDFPATWYIHVKPVHVEGCRKAPICKSLHSCVHIVISMYWFTCSSGLSQAQRYLWAPQESHVCLQKQHKQRASRGDRTHSSPKHIVQASSLEGTENTSADLSKPWDKNLLLQLLFCNVGEHPSQNTFLAGKVTDPAIHPAVLYYTTVVNRKCKEQNSLLFCTWVIVQSRRQSS